VVGKGRALKAADLLVPNSSHALIHASGIEPLVTANAENRLLAVVQSTIPTDGSLQWTVGELLAARQDVIAIDYNQLNGSEPGKLDRLRAAMLSSAWYGVTNAIPETGIDFSLDHATKLLEASQRVYRQMLSMSVQSDQLLLGYASLSLEPEKQAKLEQLSEILFGRAFRLYPEFSLYDPTHFQVAFDHPDFLNFAGELGLDEWMQGISRVRPPMAHLHQMDLLAETLHGHSSLNLTIAQLPMFPWGHPASGNERWLGVEFPENYPVPDETLSLVLGSPTSMGTLTTFGGTTIFSGIMVDEWVENIPVKEATTGIATHFNNPDSRAPQTLLLAVTPEEKGRWEWDALMDTIVETMDWAKKRAVDPELLKPTHYPQTIPAVMAAINTEGHTTSLDFGRNILKNRGHIVGPALTDEALVERGPADTN
jgi:hypothetical protein